MDIGIDFPTDDYRKTIVLNGRECRYCPKCGRWLGLFSFPSTWYGTYILCHDCAPPEILQSAAFKESKTHFAKRKKMQFLDEATYSARVAESQSVGSIMSFHGAERSKDLRRRVVAYQGKQCQFLDTWNTHNHHILSFKNYKQYSDDPYNCIILDVRLHGYVTFVGSFHYISFFFDFLDRTYGTTHYDYPKPLAPQRDLLQDIKIVNLNDFYHGTLS